MYDKQLQLRPVVSEPVKPQGYWMRFVRSHFVKPADTLQPKGMGVPRRLWQRQSALIMSLQETRKYD